MKAGSREEPALFFQRVGFVRAETSILMVTGVAGVTAVPMMIGMAARCPS